MSSLEIKSQGDFFIVRNGSSYFKLGKREGQILIDMQTGQLSENELAQKYDLNLESIQKLKQIFVNLGVIGEQKKEPFNIFFIKIPLVNPDKFFHSITSKLLSYPKISSFLFWILNIWIIYGIFLLIFYFNSIITISFNNLDPFQLFLGYVTLIICVIFHELGHGLACRYYGGQVTKLGLMLLFFSPALYCNVSSAWMFTSRKHKIFVSLAGIYVQLILLSFFLLLYKYNNNSVYLSWVVLSNIWMICINIFPFVKLDGYWTLSHATGITNLYQKSLDRVRKMINPKSEKLTYLNNFPRKIDIFLLIYGFMSILVIIVFLLSSLLGLYHLVFKSDIPFSLKLLTLCIELIIFICLFIYVLKKIYKGFCRD